MRSSEARLEWDRVASRLLPVAACVGYLVVLVVPWWLVLSFPLEADLGFAPLSWLTFAGALVGVRLLGAWVRRAAGAPVGAEWLVGLPLALVAMTAVELVQLRAGGLTSGGAVAVAFCVLLVLFGWVESHGGLERLRVPEILRVDRL